MRSALSSWINKSCIALFVLLVMGAFLILHRSYLCDAPVEEEDLVQEDAPVEEEDLILVITSEPDMQGALTEQTMLLKAISEDVDSVNQSLNEIAAILKEEPSR